MFSKLCPISLNTWAKILRHMEGYIFTIWNRLESLLILSKKFRGMFRGRFRVYQNVSFLWSFIVSFLWSFTPKFLKFTQNNGMAIWNINCRVESVNGTFEHIIRNSVRSSMFSILYPISSNTFTKVLQLMEGYIETVWNSLESVLGLFKSSAECITEDSVFSILFHFMWSVALLILKLDQKNAQTIWSSF